MITKKDLRELRLFCKANFECECKFWSANIRRCIFREYPERWSEEDIDTLDLPEE